MTLDDLKKIQNIDTELLFHVADICEKHNITYFLMYGSLIGAVRHGGPIPWDDDIDIGMTRENYMRFLEVASNELDEKYNIRIMGSGSPEYLSELKIGKKGTSYYLEGTQDLNIMSQIQLDVFMLDYIKDLSNRRKKVYEKIREVLRIASLNWDEKRLIMRCAKDSKRRFKFLSLTGLVLSHVVHIIFGEKQIEKLFYKMFVDETQQTMRMGVVYNGGPLHTWPSDCFTETEFLNYSGKQIRVPKNYHRILSDCYGDYMQFPPEDKRYKKRFEQYVLKIEE